MRQTTLCRTNAAAVAALLGGIAEGKRPFLVGGGADVIAFVEAAKALKAGRGTSHPELACFGSWGEVEDYAKLDEGEDLRLMVKIIKEFGCEPILRALRSMPPEEDADLIISTAHKAKGREWDRVKLASDFPVLSKCGDAEKKLVYVAVTRAKLTLDVSGCPFFTGRDALAIPDKKETNDGREQRERGESNTKLGSGLVHRRRSGKETTGDPVCTGLSQGGQEQAAVGSGVPAGQERQEKAENRVSSLPVVSTWTWFRDAWHIRGPKGRKPGEQVTVVRKNGATSREQLGAVAWENGDVSIYRSLPK